LIKGGEVIEKVAKIKYFITDKTGTLTTGKPKIKDIIVFVLFNEKEVLKKEKGLSILAPDSFLEFSGEGIEAKKK